MPKRLGNTEVSFFTETPIARDRTARPTRTRQPATELVLTENPAPQDSIREDAETLIPISKVLELPVFQRLGTNRPAKSTISRWANKGVGGIRLVSQRIGRKRFTTLVWLRRFLAETNAENPNEQEALRPEADFDQVDPAEIEAMLR